VKEVKYPGDRSTNGFWMNLQRSQVGWLSYPPEVPLRTLLILLYRALGAGVAIAIMEGLAQFGHQPLARIPFVTSIVLTMALPESDGAQPYAVIAGHVLSVLAGFMTLWGLGAGEAASAVAVGLAALLMLAGRAMHPPAGSTHFSSPGWACRCRGWSVRC
jgi:CBS-domain-containing membrane protein